MTPEQRGRVQLVDDGRQLVLAGSIDESANLIDLVARARGGQLVLDLAGITFINSLGVRDWIRMQAAAQLRGVHVELRRVAEVIVHQLNMIIATRGSAIVSSFFAPYACDRCGREDSLLVDAITFGPQLAALEPPPMMCPECGSRMAFNDFPERYFSFLATTGH
jgi:anti-anti-sigma regulatory factor